MNRIFSRADILLPAKGTDLTRWSVIACDQHTSEPEYWRNLEEFVGTAPSTLRMILPEARLGRPDAPSVDDLTAAMNRYLASGQFTERKGSYIYLERRFPSGVVRRGIVGVIDLDAYEYAADARSLIRATEGTVEDRLPPRVAVRQAAPLELPHAMVFANDPEGSVFDFCSRMAKYPVDPLIADPEYSNKVYDFELNSGGGHLTGWCLSGVVADEVDKVFDRLFSADSTGVLLAIGDGNHSLAAAKKCGDRYALVELVNIHDDSIVFEPIHRAVFGTDPAAFAQQFGSRIHDVSQGDRSYGETVRAVEEYCAGYIARHGGRIDYIHNDDTARSMAEDPGCFALLLPALNKAELFRSVAEHGPYPKKSFSIGLADEKRFYLECRLR